MIIAAALLLAGSLPVVAADSWEEGGSGAVAILPDPRYPEGITGGSMFCVEQQWGFLFRTEPGSTVPAGTAGTITVAGEVDAVTAEVKPGAVSVKVPLDILERLKSATSMSVTIGEGKERLGAVFNLRASRRVIDAVAPRCSQINMDGYVSVHLDGISLAVIASKELLKDEIRLFRETTGKDPEIAATFIEGVPADRQLMFASLCGSVNYYGPSGCNLVGYAASGTDQGSWSEVYNTDGMHLFLDPRASSGGWPSLVTLPVVGGTEPIHWVWGGDRYLLREQVMSEEDPDSDPDETGTTE